MCMKKEFQIKTDHQSLWWNDDQSSKFVLIPNTGIQVDIISYKWLSRFPCEKESFVFYVTFEKYINTCNAESYIPLRE